MFDNILNSEGSIECTDFTVMFFYVQYLADTYKKKHNMDIFNVNTFFVLLPNIFLSSNFSIPEENNLLFNQRSLYISDGHNGELITP